VITRCQGLAAPYVDGQVDHVITIRPSIINGVRLVQPGEDPHQGNYAAGSASRAPMFVGSLGLRSRPVGHGDHLRAPAGRETATGVRLPVVSSRGYC
jgi:hypothetical protein